MKISDSVVMITGAGQGIGEQTARRFAAAGAKVGLIARTESKVAKIRDEIVAAGGDAIAIRCDVSNEEDVINAVKTMEEAYGRIDVLVNNAASFRGGLVEEMSLEDWQYVIRIILDGTFLCCKYTLPGMKERRYGRIINICSAAVSHPFKTYSCYAAAKSGLLAFTKTAQEEIREYGINMNCLTLGLIHTEEVKKRNNFDWDLLLQPDDVANSIMFLASDEGRGYKGAAREVFGDYQ